MNYGAEPETSPARERTACLTLRLPLETARLLRLTARRRGYAGAQDFLCAMLNAQLEREYPKDQRALLLETRRRRGLTQKELAALLRCSRQSVCDYERRISPLPDEYRRRLELLLRSAEGEF